MEYKLITDTEIDKIEDLVNKHIKAGWQLQGGISVVAIGTNTAFAQAMIKV